MKTKTMFLAGITTLALASATALGVLATAGAAAPTSSTAAPTSSTAASPAAATSAAAPGRGWYLTEVDQGRAGQFGIDATHQKIVLVSPDGDRREVMDHAVRKHANDYLQLSGWSADGSTALVSVVGNSHDRAILVDVASGRRTTVDLPRTTMNVTFAPGDTDLIATGFSTGDNSAYPLYRVTPEGVSTRLASSVSGAVLSAPEDRLITGGATYHQSVVLVLDATTGDVVRTVRTPHTSCQPVRWWAAGSVLVVCTHGADTRMGVVDLAAGRLRMLTPKHPRGVYDLGDYDARRNQHGLFLQVAGACGTTFVAKALPHGDVREIKIPHSIGNVIMVDATRTRLVVQHATDCDADSPRSVLATVTPSNGHERVITELARNQAFGTVLPFGEVRPSVV